MIIGVGMISCGVRQCEKCGAGTFPPCIWALSLRRQMLYMSNDTTIMSHTGRPAPCREQVTRKEFEGPVIS